MDLLDLGSVGLAVKVGGSQEAKTSFVDNLPLLVAAVLVWYAETRLRGRRGEGGGSIGVPQLKRVLRSYAPEALGLGACIALVAVLLSRRNPAADVSPEDLEAWEAINKEWPILTTADSLLAIQAMLRLLLLLSAILRPGGASGSVDARPIVGLPAVFFFAAGLVRLYLLVASPDHALEGPLAGHVHTAFEVASLPLLLKLSLGSALSAGSEGPSVARRVLGFLAFVIAVAVASYGAMKNHIPLANDLHKDSAFTLAELLEVPGALALLWQTVFSGSRVQHSFASFAHVLLPVQQALPWYFFLVAFDSEMDKSSVGEPLRLLKICGAVQVGALLLASALHFALGEETPQEEPTAPVAGRLSATVF